MAGFRIYGHDRVDKVRPRFRGECQSRSRAPWENRVCFRASTTNTAGGMYMQTFIQRYLSAGFLNFAAELLNMKESVDFSIILNLERALLLITERSGDCVDLRVFLKSYFKIYGFLL